MARQAPPRDPWRNAPVGELQEQLLPRWFVILALISVPVAVAAFVAAFTMFGSDEVPVAERRPPPAGGLTHAVGEFAVGTAAPVPYEPVAFDAGDCPALDGIRIAGEAADLAALSDGLDALCAVDLDPITADRVRAFAEAGGVVRFAVFEATGVDSTADLDGGRILINAKFSQTNPAWIAPLVAHDTTMLSLEPGQAEAALAARRAEDTVCAELLGDRLASRACDDAAALLAAPDPLADLRAAGYR
ncbi:MAG TPA: hypothetical protein VM287_08125 [Egibacteraceae bacterium]|nr:hypothetical protein [Egibacteraceae bacterium]